jgi:hypothetical protein
VSITAESLRGAHVVEAGLRQAWSFLGFAWPDSDEEVRVYIDTAFDVEPGAQRYDDGDSFRAGQALIGFATLTVTKSDVESCGALILAFNDGRTLRIEGSASAFTTGEPWWLGRS